MSVRGQTFYNSPSVGSGGLGGKFVKILRKISHRISGIQLEKRNFENRKHLIRKANFETLEMDESEFLVNDLGEETECRN